VQHSILNARTAALRADFANGAFILLHRQYPEGTCGPTGRQIDVAIHALVAAKQAVVRRGPGWARVELRRGGQGGAK